MNMRRISLLFGVLCLLVFVSTGRGQDAELKRQVNQAIDKGVAYLKKLQQPDGTWRREGEWREGEMGGHQVGATALAGWTLLECGEDPNSPSVRKAAQVVREASVSLTYNYAICLSILFLDKLGDPDDGDLIDSLAIRLLAGQTPHGGWDYRCPVPPQEEKARLTALLRKRPATRELPKILEPVKQKVRSFQELPKPLQQLWLNVRDQDGVFRKTQGDNSNTQFAALALWVARRRGLPVDEKLVLIEQRYRSSQWDNGGWGYMPGRPPGGTKIQLPPGAGPSAAMTCAGLIGLAVGHGVASNKGGKADLEKDKILKAGLKAVGGTIGSATGDPQKALSLVDGGRAYYYFWTLERMAVLYDLQKIGGQDWYAWGAEILVKNQKQDGSWKGESHLEGKHPRPRQSRPPGPVADALPGGDEGPRRAASAAPPRGRIGGD
jgi:hypothetical protein